MGTVYDTIYLLCICCAHIHDCLCLMYLGTRIRLRWSRLVLLSGNDETMLIVDLTATQLLQDLYARPISSARKVVPSPSRRRLPASLWSAVVILSAEEGRFAPAPPP
jgi:hypothetical protein